MVSSSLVHVFNCYFFVVKLELDIAGLGIATLITYTIQLLVLIAYVKTQNAIKEAIFLPNAESLEGWKEYFELAIPATIMICAEWWAYEILTLMTGRIGVVE